RAELAETARAKGGARLLVNNASELGPSPSLPAAKLGAVTADHLRRIFDVNVVAPVLLTSALLPQLRANAGRVVNISSDAAVEAYPGWGNYGASKAALDHVSAVLSEEEPDLRVYAVDPGDMNTAMHQAAFPGEDISDREDPAAVAATLLPLIDSTLPSGRYCAAELPAAVTSGPASSYPKPQKRRRRPSGGASTGTTCVFSLPLRPDVRLPDSETSPGGWGPAPGRWPTPRDHALRRATVNTGDGRGAHTPPASSRRV